jgi:hypothetical protein
MKHFIVAFLTFSSLALGSFVSKGGLPGVSVSGSPGGANLCLVSGSTTTASWGSCASGSGVAGTWAATTGNIVTTNGANTAQDSGTALTGLAPKDAPAFTTSLTCSYATASTVPYLDASKHLVSSAVTPTELGYLSGVTSAIQTQLDTKAPLASPTFTGTAGLASATVSGSLKSGNYHLEPCENDAGNSGTALTVDLSTCAAQKITLTGNVTLTLSNPVTGGAYVFKIATGAGSFTVTWPAAVKWAGGTAPTITTAASKVDLVNLYWDGTNYFGSFTQNY